MIDYILTLTPYAIAAVLISAWVIDATRDEKRDYIGLTGANDTEKEGTHTP